MMAFFRFSNVNSNKNGLWLLIFSLFYSLIFFPGALFNPTPPKDPEVYLQATELFLLLPKLIFLSFCVLLGFLEHKNQIARHPVVFLGFILLIISIISQLNSSDESTYKIIGGRRRFDGLIYQIFLSGLIIFGFTALVKIHNLKETLSKYLILGAVFQACIVIGQYLGFDPWTNSRLWQSASGTGLLSHPGMVAALLFPALLLAFHRFYYFNLTFDKISCFCLAIGLSIVSNRSSLIACLICIVGIFWINKKKSILFFIAMVATMLFSRQLIPSQNSSRNLSDGTTLQTRLLLWKMTAKIMPNISGFPWIGGGVEALRFEQLKTPNLYLEDLKELNLLEFGWKKTYQLKSLEIYAGAGEKARDKLLRFTFTSNLPSGKDFVDVDFTWDKAHNFWLEKLAGFGFLAVLLWFYFYIFPIYFAWKNGNDYVRSFSFVLIGLSIYYLTWFPVMQVEPLHVLMVLLLWIELIDPQYKPINFGKIREFQLTPTSINLNGSPSEH